MQPERLGRVCGPDGCGACGDAGLHAGELWGPDLLLCMGCRIVAGCICVCDCDALARVVLVIGAMLVSLGPCSPVKLLQLPLSSMQDAAASCLQTKQS